MSISTHSSHEQSGIGMNFHETSQKQAPWKSSGPVLPDSWSTEPCLQRGVKIVPRTTYTAPRLYIVLARFLTSFGTTAILSALHSPAGPITFRLISVLYSEEEEEEEEEEEDEEK